MLSGYGDWDRFLPAFSSLFGKRGIFEETLRIDPADRSKELPGHLSPCAAADLLAFFFTTYTTTATPAPTTATQTAAEMAATVVRNWTEDADDVRDTGTTDRPVVVAAFSDRKERQAQLILTLTTEVEAAR